MLRINLTEQEVSILFVRIVSYKFHQACIRERKIDQNIGCVDQAW